MTSKRTKYLTLLLTLTGLIAITVTLFAATLAWDAWQLPYNAQGRYFDPVTGVVTSDNAPLGYAFLAAVSGIFAMAALAGARRLWFNTRTSLPSAGAREKS